MHYPMGEEILHFKKVKLSYLKNQNIFKEKKIKH